MSTPYFELIKYIDEADKHTNAPIIKNATIAPTAKCHILLLCNPHTPPKSTARDNTNTNHAPTMLFSPYVYVLTIPYPYNHVNTFLK